MNFKSLNLKIFETLVAFSFVFLLSTFYLLPSTLVTAQQLPEFMVTWKSDNYAPPSYQGKILPIANSQIEVALEIIDKGKLVNLSGNEIRWLINDNELKSGIGLKNISFTAEGFKGDQKIEITIKNYREVDLEKTVEIPLARPEVVIAGGPTIFETLPFFFNFKNISQAAISWSVNGQTAVGLVEKPAILEIDNSQVPAGSNIQISATVSNKLNQLEIASQSINIQK